MSIESELREYEAREMAADMRDARIDSATDSAMKVITASELMNVLSENCIDSGEVDQGLYAANSVEDMFDDILGYVRAQASGEYVESTPFEKLFFDLVHAGLKEAEIEPFWEDS